MARESNQSGQNQARPPEEDASLYLHPQTLAKLGSFELRAKLIVEGLSSGLHTSPFQGFSVEFAQHRPYVPGDDLRHLDWKVYGRTDRLQLKQYQQETNLDLAILVDASGSMMYGTRPFEDASGTGRTRSLDGRETWSKFDHATALAAALSYITLRQGDRVGLGIFDEQLRAIVKRSSSQGQWRQIVGALSQHPVSAAAKSKGTDFSKMIDQALAKLANRCMVAIISDLFVDLPIIREMLARVRHAGHDLLVFQVLDDSEIHFAFQDAAPFEGMENEGLVRVDPRALRETYLEVFETHRAGVEKMVRGAGYDYQRLSTHDWLGPPLASFVARRNAMIKRNVGG